MHVLTIIISGGYTLFLWFDQHLCCWWPWVVPTTNMHKVVKSALLSVSFLNPPDITTYIYLQSPPRPTSGNWLHL